MALPPDPATPGLLDLLTIDAIAAPVTEDVGEPAAAVRQTPTPRLRLRPADADRENRRTWVEVEV